MKPRKLLSLFYTLLLFCQQNNTSQQWTPQTDFPRIEYKSFIPQKASASECKDINSLPQASLFDDPTLIKTDQLLKNSCSRIITMKALLAVYPGLKKRHLKFQLPSNDLSPGQCLALHLLTEKLFERCDTIICDPAYQLKEEGVSELQQIKIKPFQDFAKNSTELLFLKHYWLLSKLQNDPCFIPSNFSRHLYLNTTTFDHFFESSSIVHDKNELTRISNKVKNSLNGDLYNLAQAADQLEEIKKLQEHDVNANNQKRPRDE